MRRLLGTSAATALTAALAVGCSGGSGAPSAAPTATSSPGAGVVVPAPTSAAASASPQVSVPAGEVVDAGLPSQLPTKLNKKNVKKLAQFFEDKVSASYAGGKPDELYHYLAGPMLTGNRGTINYLNSQSKRNVYRIRVKSVTLQTNAAHRVVFTMNGDMTVDYFFNPKTKKILDNGLPGPSQVQFVMFFDQNPRTKTWYWTGEQSAANGTGGAQSGSNGTVVNPQ